MVYTDLLISLPVSFLAIKALFSLLALGQANVANNPARARRSMAKADATEALPLNQKGKQASKQKGNVNLRYYYVCSKLGASRRSLGTRRKQRSHPVLISIASPPTDWG